MGCVYVATNQINGKQYVGQTVKTLDQRRKEHEWYANHPYKRFNQTIHSALMKYGVDNFKWEVAFETDDVDELKSKEIEIIEQLGTFKPNGYNLTLGGDFPPKYGGGPVEVSCCVCGVPVVVTRKHFTRGMRRGGNFVCSDGCLRVRRSLNASGPNNPKLLSMNRGDQHV